MSIYSTEMCPKCDEGCLILNTAYSWEKLRFDCENGCGYCKEVKLTRKQCVVLREILKKK